MGIGTPFSGGMSSSVGVFGGGRPPGGRAYAGANVLVLTAETMLSPVDWDGANELTLIVDATAASFNVILPAIAELLPGQRVTLVKVTAANTVTLVAELGETLRGNASEALTALWTVAAWVVPKVGLSWWPVSGAGGSAQGPAVDTVLTKVAPYTITVADCATGRVTLLANFAAGTIDLPSVAAVAIGTRITLIKINGGAGSVVLDPAGAETIRGNPTEAVANIWETRTIVNTGVLWYNVASSP